MPDYWIGHPEPLTRKSGMNRFVWDLRYAPPPVLRHEYPISALYQGTPGLPLGAIATPGTYRVKLQVNGRTYEQPLTVAMDPRVDVSNEALAQQLDLESKIIDLVAESYDFYHKALLVRQTLAGDQKELEKHAGAALTTLKDFDQKAMRLQGSDTGFGGGAGRGVKQAPAFAPLNRNLGSLASIVDGQDAAPTPAMQSAYEEYCHDLASAAQSWNALLKDELPGVNGALEKQGVGPLAGAPLAVPACR